MPPLEGKYNSRRIKKRDRARVLSKLLEVLPGLLSCELEPDEFDGLPFWEVTTEMIKVDWVRLGWWRRRRNFGMSDLNIYVEAQAFRARLGHERDYSAVVTKALWPLLADDVSCVVWLKLVHGGWSACVGGQKPL